MTMSRSLILRCATEQAASRERRNLGNKVLLIVLIAFCRAGVVQSQNSSLQSDAQREYAKGVSALGKRNFGLAIASFTEVIRLDPKLAQAYCGRGLAFSGDREYDRAIADYSEAIRLYPTYAVAYENRGVAFCRKGEYDNSIADCSESIRLNPKSASAFDNRGAAFWRKGDKKKAIADFNEAIRIDPKFTHAYSDRGVAFSQSGDYDRAIADYREVIRLTPNDAHSYYDLGGAYGGNRQYEMAITAFSEAIRRDPKYAAAYDGRAYAYRQKQEYDKALCDLSVLISLDPKYAAAYQHRGLAFSDNREYDKAIADFSESIRLDPKNAWCYSDRAVAYEAMQEYEKAITDFGEAIRLNPKYAITYEFRGYAYGKTGQFDKEISDCSEAIRLGSKNPSSYNNRGNAYGRKGDYRKAIADYTEAIRLGKTVADSTAPAIPDANAAEPYRRRGVAYGRTGDESRAKADFEVVDKAALNAALAAVGEAPFERSSPSEVGALENYIRHEVEGFDNAEKLAKQLVETVRNWNLGDMHHKLTHLRRDQLAGKVPMSQVAAVEEKAARTLAVELQMAFGPIETKYGGCELGEVLASRTACCVGHSQLFQVVGKSIGLSVRSIDVLHADRGPSSGSTGHVACAVELTDSRTMLVDLERVDLRTMATPPFKFNVAYRKIGSCWDLTDNFDPMGLPRRLQFLAPHDGLAAAAYLNRAGEMSNRGNVAGALELIDKAVSFDPEFASARVARSGLLARSNRFPAALADANEVIRLDPGDAKCYYARGYACQNSGDGKGAVSDYTEVIRLCPAYSDGYVGRAAAYVSIGEYDKAIIDCNDAIRLSPNCAGAFFYRGCAYEKKGEKGKAQADFAEEKTLSGTGPRITDYEKAREIVEIERFVDLTTKQRAAMSDLVAASYESLGRNWRQNAQKILLDDEVLKAWKSTDPTKVATAKADRDKYGKEYSDIYVKLWADLESVLTPAQRDKWRKGTFVDWFRQQTAPVILADDIVNRISRRFLELNKADATKTYERLRPYVAGILTKEQKRTIVKRIATDYINWAFSSTSLTSEQRSSLSNNVDSIAVESRFDSDWPNFVGMNEEIRKRTIATLTAEQRKEVSARLGEFQTEVRIEANH
jgi:tetratricopeptide (TPR) repeat protein